MIERFGLLDLLNTKSVALEGKCKMLRHGQDAKTFLRQGWFEYYQAFQVRKDFDGVKYMVSLIGLETQLALFHGVYKVHEQLPGSQAVLPEDCPFHEWNNDDHKFFKMEEMEEFKEFKDRVVIDWGPSPLSWVQNLKNRPVVEIRRSGKGLEIFRDYLDFNITHHELKSIVADPGANQEWIIRLAAVSGIYLIQDTATGQQYVGSAYGEEGIWGRWKQYAKNGHGGNKLLHELVQKDERYPRAFQYTLLQVLPRSMDANSVIRWESIFKEKLGSRVSGLNLN